MGPLTKPRQGAALIYLLHFDRARAGKQHYLGSTNPEQLLKRLRRHQLGTASHFTRAMHIDGIGFRLAQLWSVESREYEDTLKQRGKFKHHCTFCNPLRQFHHSFANVPDFPPIASKPETNILGW